MAANTPEILILSCWPKSADSSVILVAPFDSWYVIGMIAVSLHTSWLSVPAAEVKLILELGKRLIEIVCFTAVQLVPTLVISTEYVLVLLTTSDGDPVIVI